MWNFISFPFKAKNELLVASAKADFHGFALFWYIPVKGILNQRLPEFAHRVPCLQRDVMILAEAGKDDAVG